MSQRLLLVGCGEPAAAKETDAFARSFAEAEVDRVLMPGGCWWLAEAASATSGRFRRAILGEHVPVRDALIRFITDTAIGRVILLSHQGCEWYARQFPDLTAGEQLKHAGADMFAARDELLRIGPPELVVEGHVYIAGGPVPGFRQLFPSASIGA